MPTLTVELYERIKHELAARGHGDDYTWSQNLKPPATAEDFACEYVWVVLNSGMRNTVARLIADRMWPALRAGKSAGAVFGHPGKVAAIDKVWLAKDAYFDVFMSMDMHADASRLEIVEWCQTLPWIGKITKYHLAKNLGVDVAKPDRWLERLAAAEDTTCHLLCDRLAYESGDRIATVDVVLWRACAIGVLTIQDGVVTAPGLDK